MLEPKHRRFTEPTTVELALVASMAAIYIVSTLFPVSPFVGGGPGFITFEIIMLPIIAILLRPPLAIVTVLVGSLGMALGQASFLQIFGFPGFLVPLIAVAVGSIAFHYRLGPLVPWAYVLFGALFYIAFSKGGTILWLAPYALVILSLPLALKLKGNARIAILCLYTAMAEQVTLNVLSISLLGLVGPVWAVITPFMYGERALATVLGAIAVVALKSGLGRRLDLDNPVFVEVRR